MMSPNKAVLIDRDGTIARKMAGYGGFQLLPTVTAGIKLFNEHDIKVIMVEGSQASNESKPSEDASYNFADKLLSDIALGDARIDRVCHYSNHIEADFSKRVPAPDELEQTLLEWEIDKASSYLIGDTFSDMEIADSIGCGAVIVPSNLPELELLFNRNISGRNINFVSRDFISASRWVLAHSLPMSDVSIIIPTKNEEHNLPHIVPYLPRSAEIILVDGHSTDNTVKVAMGLRPDAIILTQEGTGKGNALKMGFNYATREFVITFDADGSFRPGEVYGLIQKLRQGYDLVKGSRFMPGGGTADMPRNRIIGNWGLTTVANVLYGGHYSDLVYGFHAFRRDAVNQILLHSDGFEMDTELYLRAARSRLKIAEIPSFEDRRLWGNSHLNSFRDGIGILKTILRERFRE